MSVNENDDIEPTSVGVSRGLAWVTEGFSFFTRDWLAWIGLSILLIVLTMVSSAIPIANIIVPVITPIIGGGLMLGCRKQDEGGELGIGVVFSGFSTHTSQLALIGVIYLLANLAIVFFVVVFFVIVIGGLGAISEFNIEDPDLLLKHSIFLLLAALIGMSLYLPVVMAIWFAPGLVVFRKLSAVPAMLLSIKACVVNILPFLLYGFVVLVVMIFASIPLMLGWLVLVPVLIASVYISYKDAFPELESEGSSTGLLTP